MIIRKAGAQILEGHVKLRGSKKDQKEFAVRVGKDHAGVQLRMKKNEQHAAKLPETT